MRNLILRKMFFVRHGYDYFPLINLSYEDQPDAEFWKPMSFLLSRYSCMKNLYPTAFIRQAQFDFIIRKFGSVPEYMGMTPWFVSNTDNRVTLAHFQKLINDALMLAISFDQMVAHSIHVSCWNEETGKTHKYWDVPYIDAVMNPGKYTFHLEYEKSVVPCIVNSFYTISYGDDEYLSLYELQQDTGTPRPYQAIRFKTEDDALEYCEINTDFLGDKSYEVKLIEHQTII